MREITFERLRRRAIGALIAACMLATMLSTAHAHVSCATSKPGGGDWPMMGGDLSGARNQRAESVINPANAGRLAPSWVFDANRATGMPNNEITGYPIVANGCVYVGSSMETFGRSGWLFALNADTGELVWRTKVNGGVYSTVAHGDRVIYAFVSRISSPYVVALNADTGRILWETTVDNQIGADAVSSPILFDGMVWVGISGTAAEVNEGDRSTFQGSQVLLDARTGDQITKIYSIPPDVWADGFSGGSVWGTIAIDAETKYGYAGSGNPFDYENEHANTNAVLKVDLDRSRPTFGEIVGSYKGTVEEYDAVFSDTIPCQELEEVPELFAAGLECLRLDLDFGVLPNIMEDSTGRKLIAAGQKSGVLHVIDAETMDVVYTKLLGIPSAVGGIVGSSAYDGKALYGPHTVGSYLWSTEKDDGALRWVAPVGSGVNWGPPATYANGVVYTVELAGFLDAFDAATGRPLLRYPLTLSPESPGAVVPVTNRPMFSWGGVTVARHTVYVSAGVGLTSAGFPSMSGGFVVAFRPRAFP
ncbi:MAG TPA: PQQ-binding-like beta-propeller repeat protein [Actinomycetota bacterium]|nr:PQQ-binding-like beta-propeller repeat protein [Actinomycetota bacterium]